MRKKMNKMNLLLVLMIALIILGPIATIWSLNTLFPVLAIPYTFETWVAAVVIAGIIRGDGLSFKGK
jgi:hypothetical protein